MPQARAWLTKADGKWRGWGEDAKEVELEDTEWTPWDVALDAGKAPFFEWFIGGKTSAAFNEVDRHVLSGHGDETAFIHAGPAAFQV